MYCCLGWVERVGTSVRNGCGQGLGTSSIFCLLLFSLLGFKSLRVWGVGLFALLGAFPGGNVGCGVWNVLLSVNLSNGVHGAVGIR